MRCQMAVLILGLGLLPLVASAQTPSTRPAKQPAKAAALTPEITKKLFELGYPAVGENVDLGVSQWRSRSGRKTIGPLNQEEIAAIQALLGEMPRRRELLIECLHRIQDHFGHITSAHLVALADELKLAMVEVYEVATFYHHFDVVKDAEQPPPSITVKVCESITCAMFGGQALQGGEVVEP